MTEYISGGIRRCYYNIPNVLKDKGIEQLQTSHRLIKGQRELVLVFAIHGKTLTLYALCVILQYVYKPTRCTEFL